jgi:hypothetical protein
MEVVAVVVETTTVTTWQAEPELQAMPLSTNHPLYFYFA